MSVPALRFKEFNENDAHHNAFKSFVIKDVANIQVGRDLKEDSFSETQTAKHKFPVYSNTVEKLGLYGFYDFEEYDGNSLTVVGRGAGLGTAFARSSGFAAIGRLLVISPKSNEFNVKYFAEYVNFKLQIHNESGGIPQLPGSTFGMYSIVLPSIAEQTKIANFLKVVDEKITQLTQKHDLLTQYKKGVMQQIFSHSKERSDCTVSYPRGISQELRFKDDDGQDFPEWEQKELGDIVDVMQSGVSRMLNDSDIGLPVIRSNNLIENKLDISDLKYWYTIDNQGVNLENYFLNDGDLLVNFINSLAQIGKVALFENLLNRNTIFTTNLMRLSFKSNVNTKYIACFFQTNDYLQHIQAITKPAVNQASFTTKEFKTLVIPFPSKQEQTKIANFLTAIDDKITATQTQLRAVKQYKQSLLQQMFV